MTGVAPSAPPSSGRAHFSRRWIAFWLLGAVLTGVVFLAAGAVLIVNQPHRYVIEAQTEAMRVPAAFVGIDDAWSVRGAEICEESFTSAGFGLTCRKPSLEDVVLVIPNGASLGFQRLDRSIEAMPGAASEAAAGEERMRPAPLEVTISAPAGASVDLHQRGRAAPLQGFSGSVVLRWRAPPLSPLDFRGLAIIGQLPERGNRGMLLGGRASAHMAARAGAPRFEIAGAELVSGDVTSVVMPEAQPWQVRLLCRLRDSLRCLPPGAAEMWGFVRFSADMPSGFAVVYAGPAERVVVDRLGAHFELKPGWAARLQLDPLAQLLYSGATLAAGLLTILVSLKAGKIIYRDIRDRRIEGEGGCSGALEAPAPGAQAAETPAGAVPRPVEPEHGREAADARPAMPEGRA